MIYFTSDHHFSHANIIKYCGRPFDSVETMNDEMVKSWNEAISPDDIVYYLGDFALGLDAVRTFVPRLNGKKHLIMGNHDLCHPVNKKKVELGKATYLDSGFLTLQLESEIEIAGQIVLLHHLPYLNPNAIDQYGSKYDKYRPINHGKWLLCGHIHEKWKQIDRMINVGVDVWNFRPISIDTIEELITTNNHAPP